MCVARTSKAAARLSVSFRTRDAVEKIYHAVVAGKLSGSGTRRDLLVSRDDSGAAGRRGRGPGRGPRTAVVPATGARGSGHGDPGSLPSAKLAELEWEAVGVSSSAEASLRSPATGEPRTLVRVRLVTGRKHQIRVQLAEMGHPVVGDTRYGKGSYYRREGALGSAGGWSGGGGGGGGLGVAHPSATEPLEDRSILLHASELSLPHPTRLDTRVRAVAPPPEAWGEVCGREVIDEVFRGL